MQVEGHQAVGYPSALPSALATGARVSNAYRTCPALRDSLAKASLIPDAALWPHGPEAKDSSARDGGASH